MEKIFNEFANVFTPKTIWNEMKKILRDTDPDYFKEEAAYIQGIRDLFAGLSPEKAAEAAALIGLREESAAADLTFLFWQGLHLNLECFRFPVSRLFLRLDYEDILQESTLQTLPIAQKYQSAAQTFFRDLSGEQYELFEPVRAYYSYMQTVARKLAHYCGFALGDSLLPHAVPGYAPNHALTLTYRSALCGALDLEPHETAS